MSIVVKKILNAASQILQLITRRLFIGENNNKEFFDTAYSLLQYYFAFVNLICIYNILLLSSTLKQNGG